MAGKSNAVRKEREKRPALEAVGEASKLDRLVHERLRLGILSALSVNESLTFKAIFREMVRYWEPRRIVYNVVLAAVVVAWIAFTWPHFRPAFTMGGLLVLLVLAAIANACYCAAYVADAAMQRTPFRSTWLHARWAFWLAGTLFAIALAWYWIADEVYPYVG